LLTWPEAVQARFRKWGRQWPEDEDKGRVLFAIVDYMEAYPAYVTMVYNTFKPFDYETGEGIVVAAPKEALLRPSVFDTAKPPDLGKVWAAQERLWIQRTMFEVIAQVNKNAKKWDDAIIKQIESLEVGNSNAQDQRSLANSETLEEAPKIFAKGEEPTEDSAGGGGAGMMGGGGGGMSSMMAGMRRGGMGGGGGNVVAQDGGSVYYIKAGNESQYKILPVLMTVLIDQDHIQDFLIELENSPMSIQVKDFEMVRPASKVNKPEKGTTPFGGGFGGGMGMGMGMNSMMSSMMRRGGMGGMSGFGGRATEMSSMGMAMGMMGQRMGGMGGGYGGMGAMGGAAVPERKGIDKRGVDAEKERKAREKAALDSRGPAVFDPYFNIVQVTVYGQARFFNAPPEEPAAEPSPGDTTAAAAPAATGAAQPGTTPAAGADSDTAKAAATPTPAPPRRRPQQETRPRRATPTPLKPRLLRPKPASQKQPAQSHRLADKRHGGVSEIMGNVTG
jgi:hypothetical protein